MYNVSITFGTTPQLTGPTPLMLLVLVTDATTAAPITGLVKEQFTVHAFELAVGEPVLHVQRSGFIEIATVDQANYPSAALLPGLYLLQVNFPTAPEPVKGSNAMAVTVTNAVPQLGGGVLEMVMGLGVATYNSPTGKN
jgi:hypothetical protein